MRGRTRDYAHCDTAMVDELAVEWACQGTPMQLNDHEQVAAVRQLIGRVTLSEIARRTGGHTKTINRIMVALDAVKCPICWQLSLHTDGVLARHMDSVGIAWCPMSGQWYQDQVAVAAGAGWCAGKESSQSRQARRRAAQAVS